MAVSGLAVASPCESVTAVTTLVPLELNVPLAPVAGAVKVTVVPATSTGFPLASSMVAPRCEGKAVLTWVL